MKALCLSGGGFKGIFQLPVIKHLLETNDFDYDHVYGVSIGAIHGAMVAQDKFEDLLDIWDNIQRITDAMKPRWWWPFSGLYDLSPLRRDMDRHIHLEDFQTKFSAGLVSLTDGRYYHRGTQHAKDSKQLRDWIQGSASITGLMQTYDAEIDGIDHIVADGGFRTTIPLPPPDSYDHIDVVVCNPLDINPVDNYSIRRNAKEEGVRCMEIFKNEILNREVMEILDRSDIDPTVNLYFPRASTGPSFKMNESLRELRWSLGEYAAKNPIKL